MLQWDRKRLVTVHWAPCTTLHGAQPTGKTSQEGIPPSLKATLNGGMPLLEHPTGVNSYRDNVKQRFEGTLKWKLEGVFDIMRNVVLDITCEMRKNMIKFTVFGDLHYDETSDGDKRVSELVEHVNAAKPDFVVSLGDLCKPVEENKEIVLNKFMETGIPMHHTIGNHE